MTMDQFIQLLRESVITEFVISVAVVIVDGVMLLEGLTIPDWWQTATGIIIGAYFGARIGVAKAAAVKASTTSGGD